MIFNNVFKATDGDDDNELRKLASSTKKFADEKINEIIFGEHEKKKAPKKSPAAAASSKATTNSSKEKTIEEQWVQCDACKKWRNVPHSIDPQTLPDRWECKDNTWNSAMASCAAKETSVTDDTNKTAKGVTDVANPSEATDPEVEYSETG